MPSQTKIAIGNCLGVGSMGCRGGGNRSEPWRDLFEFQEEPEMEE